MKKTISLILAFTMCIMLATAFASAKSLGDSGNIIIAVDEKDQQILNSAVPHEHNLMVPAQGEVQFGAEERTVLGATYSIDQDGKTSAFITDNTITWLREESDFTATWYGIDNSAGTFPLGSQFWVKALSSDSDRAEFDENISKFTSLSEYDEEHNHGIILVGVVDPNGEEYKTLADAASLYIQVGDDWDMENIKPMMASDDEELLIENVQLVGPEGKDFFAKLTLIHFGAPIIILEKQPLVATIFVQYQPFITIGLVLVGAAIVVMIIKRQKQK